MSESLTGTLDLESLTLEVKITSLINKYTQKGLISRKNDLLIILIFITSTFGLLFRISINSDDRWFYLILIGILFLLYRKTKSTVGIYQLIENGIVVPYSWLTKKLLAWEEIIEINDIILKDKNTEEQFQCLEFKLDTKLVKYNTTGLSDTSFYLTEKEFYKEELLEFGNSIREKKKLSVAVPNTMAERLRSQASIAWNGRYERLYLNSIDILSKNIYYILILEVLMWSIFNYSLFPLIGSLLIFVVIVITLITQIDLLPSTIIGVRVNELGPLIYDEEKILTSVRFMVISFPNDIAVSDCKMIYDEDTIKQIERVKDIHPDRIISKELTHTIARIRGNHSKASGATIKIRYADDQYYDIDLFWK